MSLRNKSSYRRPNGPEEIPDLAGKTIAKNIADVDDKGYGFVEITFTDGTVLRVQEEGQCGEIEWKITRV